MKTMTGHLYVLINPAFPDMVKIGQTSRDVATRCAELSSSTGVPTPFVVAFKKEVNSPEIFEKIIHYELQNRGYRFNQNREFFSIALDEAIEVILDVFSENRHLLSTNTDERDAFADEKYEEQDPFLFELWAEVKEMEESLQNVLFGFDQEQLKANRHARLRKLEYLYQQSFLKAFPKYFDECIKDGNFEYANRVFLKAIEIKRESEENPGLFQSSVTEIMLAIFQKFSSQSNGIEFEITDHLFAEFLPGLRQTSIATLANQTEELMSYYKEECSSFVSLINSYVQSNTLSADDKEFLQESHFCIMLLDFAQLFHVTTNLHDVQIKFSGIGSHYNDEAKAFLRNIEENHAQLGKVFESIRPVGHFIYHMAESINEILGSNSNNKPETFISNWKSAWELSDFSGIVHFFNQSKDEFKISGAPSSGGLPTISRPNKNFPSLFNLIHKPELVKF